MPLPVTIPTVTLQGRFLTPEGEPCTGYLIVRVNATDTVRFSTADVMVKPPVVVPLNGGGYISVVLPATNSPDMSPTGWSYEITEVISGSRPRTYNIVLPSGQPTANLADIAPSDPLTPTHIPVQGPPGVVQSVNGISTANVVLTAANVGAVALGARGISDWLNVRSAFGAVGDGVADDTTEIQTAINAAGIGGVVYFPRGIYKISTPLDLPRGVVLQGSHSNLMMGPGMVETDFVCCIQAAPNFVGGAMITIIGDADGTHPAINGEQRIQNLMLDGQHLITAGVDGIYAKGNVQNVVMRDVCVANTTNNGIITGSNAGNEYPYSWRLHSVMVDNPQTNGIVFTRQTDLALIDCQVIGAGAVGYKLTNCANTNLTACRAEWTGSYGYHLTGNWGNWPGSGPASMTGCMTDRCGHDGLRIDATGNGAFLITGHMARRDGRNGGPGGGGYAAVALLNQAPVVISGLTCYVGEDDGGGATTSPQYGVRITGARDVQLDHAYLHAATAGLYQDGVNTRITLGPGIVTVTGLTTAEDRQRLPAQLGAIDAASLTVSGGALGQIQPAEHGLKGWTYDPVAAVNSTVCVAGTVYLCAVPLPKATSVASILWHINTAAAGGVAGQNHVGLYSPAGVLLATVGVGTPIATAGAKATAIGPLDLPAGLYWVAFLFNATTPPALARTTGITNTGTLVNAGIALPAKSRYATAGAALTALPAPIVPANNVPANGIPFWAALA